MESEKGEGFTPLHRQILPHQAGLSIWARPDRWLSPSIRTWCDGWISFLARAWLRDKSVKHLREEHAGGDRIRHKKYWYLYVLRDIWQLRGEWLQDLVFPAGDKENCGLDQEACPRTPCHRGRRGIYHISGGNLGVSAHRIRGGGWRRGTIEAVHWGLSQ